MFPPGSDLTGRDLLAASARKRRNKFDSIDDAYNRFSQKGALSSFSPSSLALYCTHGLKADPPGVSLRCNPEDEESIYLSGIANGVYDALDFVTSPCVVAFGENSTTVNREKAMAIASHLKNAKIEEIKGSGHFTLLENPFLGAQLISSFVESLNLEKLGA